MTKREKLKRFAMKHNTLLRIYRATFGQIKTRLYFNMQRKALAKNGFDIITRISKALNREGAKYFVDCGTLLGVVRDGHMIVHDRDMDFGIYFDENFKKEDLDRAMISIGLKKYRSFVFRGKTVEVSYSDGITDVDFFRHFENGNDSTLYVFQRDVLKDYPGDRYFDVYKLDRAHITGFKTITINSKQLVIPENVEAYLASAYGEQWRTPNPNWKLMDAPRIEVIDDEYGILE